MVLFGSVTSFPDVVLQGDGPMLDMLGASLEKFDVIVSQKFIHGSEEQCSLSNKIL